MTTIEAARCSTAAEDAHQRDTADDRHVSALWWVLPCFAFWCAIVWWAL